MFRRLVIGNRGRARPMHGAIVRWFGCPTTLQEAKPMAGSRLRPNVRRGGGPQTGVKAQKSTPSTSPADRFCRSCLSNRRSVTPTKINRGGRGRHERQVGPDRQKCRRDARSATVCFGERASCEASVMSPPDSGIKPAKGAEEPQERRRTTTNARREDLRRPARLCNARGG